MALCFKIILINQLHNHNQNALVSLFPLFHVSQLSNKAGACVCRGNGEHSGQKQTAEKERGEACEASVQTCVHA